MRTSANTAAEISISDSPFPCIYKYLLLASFARSVRQVMDRVFSFLLWPKHGARGPWKQGRKKRGSITCRTDRANEANKMFIIWLWWLLRFWKGDRELEVRTPTYGLGIDQSQHAKSVSHIIMINNTILAINVNTTKTYVKIKIKISIFKGV